MKIHYCSLSLLIAVAMASVVHAEATAPPPADIRCLMVGMQLSTATDTNQRTGANMLTIYYFGRLEHYSAKVLEDALFTEYVALKPTDFQSEAERCGKSLMEKGQAITKIGENLVHRGQAMQQKQAPVPATPTTAAPLATPSEK
jgi:hypothetical protein